MPRALPPPPPQLRKERLVDVGGGGGESKPRLMRKSAAFAAFVLAFVAIGIVGVGIVHHRVELASLALLNKSDLSPSLRSRLVEIHARVANAMKGNHWSWS